MIKYFIIILFLLPVIVSGFGPEESADTVTISSLPYTINTGGNGKIHILSGDLSSSTNGIEIAGASNVTIDLQGHTITHGTGGGDNSWGIRPRGGTNNLTIKNGYIKHYKDTTSVSSVNISLGYCYEILFDSLNCVVYGNSGANVRRFESTTGYKYKFTYCNFYDSIYTYTNRCHYEGAAVYIHMNESGDPEYNAWFENCNVHLTRGQGILLRGISSSNLHTFHVIDCSVHVDTRADEHNASPPTADGCLSSANGYGIGFIYADGNSEIKNCKITSGNEFYGGRGIWISMCEGTSDNYLDVCSNYVEIHEGYDAYYLFEKDSPALRIRPPATGETGTLDYIHIFDNTFICYGSPDESDSSYSDGGVGARLSTTSSTNHILIERNLFRGIQLSNTDVDRGSAAIRFDASNASSYGYELKNNRLEGNYRVITFGGTNSNASYHISTEDTFKIIDSTSYIPNPYTFRIGGAGTCVDNYVRNAYYDSSVRIDTLIEEDRLNTAEIFLQEKFIVYVKGNDDSLVSNASVTVTNNYGQTIINSASTGDSGFVWDYATYWYKGINSSDSSNFNDFSVSVTKSGTTNSDSSVTLTQNWDSLVVDLNVDGDVGSDGGDSESPNRILDFKNVIIQGVIIDN